MTSRRLLIAGLAVIAVSCAVVGRAVQTTSSRPAATAAMAARTGATPAGREVAFTLLLDRGAAREHALQTFLTALQDPSSPSYRRFIGASAFGRRFGASDAQLDRITAWLRDRGMRIDQPAAQRTSLRVHATAGELEAAFGVALDDYRDGAGHRWHEPARVAQIPAALAADVAGLSGLSDRPRFSLVSEAGAPSSGYDAAT